MTGVRSGNVVTEGDRLYFEVRGEGPALLMIPPAGGDGAHYLALVEHLTDAFKVIIYDRRANARSSGNPPQNFEVSQQSRDAVAVLAAAGVDQAHVFGVSSGAVIALDIAKTQPQAALSVLAFEPPVAGVVHNAAKMKRHFANCYLTGRRFGAALGGLQFIFGIHVPAVALTKGSQQATKYAIAHKVPGEPERIAPETSLETLIFHEMLPITNYMPDLAATQRNGLAVRLGVGTWARERSTWLAEAAHLLAAGMGQDAVVLPGHHGGYMVQPAEWAAVFKELLL